MCCIKTNFCVHFASQSFFAQGAQILVWLILKSHPPVIVCESKLFAKVLLLAKIVWCNTEWELSHGIQLHARGRKFGTVWVVGSNKLNATQIINNEKSLTISSQSVLVKSGFGPWWLIVPYGSKITNPVYSDGCSMPSLQILIEEVWGQTAEQHSSLATGRRVMPMETWIQETGMGGIKVQSMVLDHQLVLWTLSGCWEIVCFKSLQVVLSGKESRRASMRLLLKFGCERDLESQKCRATTWRQKPSYRTFEEG